MNALQDIAKSIPQAAKKKVAARSLYLARSLPVEYLLPQNVGSIINYFMKILIAEIVCQHNV